MIREKLQSRDAIVLILFTLHPLGGKHKNHFWHRATVNTTWRINDLVMVHFSVTTSTQRKWKSLWGRIIFTPFLTFCCKLFKMVNSQVFVLRRLRQTFKYDVILQRNK